MNKQWLKEVHALVKAEVISDETAQRITDYYKLREPASSNNLTFILAILGALLISSGIILIAAHNWDELSRLVKTVLSFVPLLAAQVVCAYALVKQRDKIAWRECSSVFLFFAIGASISLISQIYQVSGSLDGFLLTWMLLALPLVYLLSSSMVVLLCTAGMTWYACLLGYDRQGQIPYMYAIVLLFMLPHYYSVFKTRRGSHYFYLLNWVLALSVTICLGSFTKETSNWYEWVFVLYCLLFCNYYLIGRLPYFTGKGLLVNPFLSIGLTGILFIFLMWSFDFLWEEFDTMRRPGSFFTDPLPYLIMAALIAVTGLIWKTRKQQEGRLDDPTGYSFAVFLILIAAMEKHPVVAIIAINAWVFIIAMYFIRKGSREDHLGILNFGLVVMAALAACRFFDDTIPFIWRGIFFVITGIGFFVANYLMLQKRKKINPTK